MKRNTRNNKMLSRISYISFATVLAFSLMCFSLTALAEGNVTYEGQADGFVFEPGSEESKTDLFPELKDVVPGDTFTDSVVVKNNSAEGKSVKMYMRVTGAEEGSGEFLSNLELTVSSGDSALFEAEADQTAGLTDWVLLGTLKPEASVNLDIELKVPLDMGNEYQNAKGIFGWEFKIEEIDESKPGDKPKNPDKSSKKSGAKTGDETDILLWVGLLTFAIIGILGGALSVRRKP